MPGIGLVISLPLFFLTYVPARGLLERRVMVNRGDSVPVHVSCLSSGGSSSAAALAVSSLANDESGFTWWLLRLAVVAVVLASTQPIHESAHGLVAAVREHLGT